VRLWVDDIRRPPDPTWQWASSSSAAIAVLSSAQVMEMSLDHDLGGSDTTRPIVEWLCENVLHWPPIVRVHCAAPTGRGWLLGMIYRHNPHLRRV
jgi:hypothetical protein